jgi:hypothetical protein
MSVFAFLKLRRIERRGADEPFVLWILAGGRTLSIAVFRTFPIEGIHLLNGFIFKTGRNVARCGEVAIV